MIYLELKTGGKIRFWICLLAFLVLVLPCCLFSQVQFIRPARANLITSWNQNQESDIDYYLISVGRQAGEYTDSARVFFPDTCVQICLCNKSDSVFVAIQAIDTAGNYSEYSKEISFIPAVVGLDFCRDENNRIDIEDLREVLRLIKENWARTIYK